MRYTYVRQHDSTDCAAASLAMVCLHYKKEITITRLRDMMDFEGIEKVRQRVRQNGTLAQKLTAAQMQIARFNEKLSGAEDNLSTRALAKNLSGALRQLS